MGRALKFDRHAAIERCMQDIWHHGYESCSVKAISEKLGITRSSFYNTFGSREALFIEVLTHYSSQTPDNMLADVKIGAPIKLLLTNFFLKICQDRTSDSQARGCLAVNCVAELVGVDETLGPVMENAVIGSLQRFEHLLELAVAQKEIADNGELYSKALALQNLLVGLCIMAKVIHSQQELEAVVELTLKGLGIYEQRKN
jgi:TetR/AcrR family transcriptional repressor of nem operon